MSPPNVLVSVLNWRQPNKTIRCVDSLKQLQYAYLTIVVVDNHSDDDAVRRIQDAHPDVQIVCADDNLGYAGGNALALQVALNDDRIDLFWVLNNDAIVLPDTLTALLTAYQQYGTALYGGIPVHDTDDGYRLHMRIWEHGKSRMLKNIPLDDHYATREPRPVDALSGSHLLIPIALIHEHGFMDTSFFLYSEDTDYCFRLAQAGVPLIEVPQSMIIHDDGGSHKTGDASTLKPIIQYYRSRNRIILIRRYATPLTTLLEIIRQSLYSIAWLALILTRGSTAYHTSRYMLHGILDGIRNRTGKTYAPEDALTEDPR